MADFAKLISAAASLVGAIAWPIFFAVALSVYRREVRALLARLPILFDRMRKVKGLGFEAVLVDLADKAPENGAITPDQVRVAARLAASGAVDSHDLSRELDALCLEYDVLRRTMSSSAARTREMTRTVVQMRALGPSASSMIGVYKGSGSAGSRLAAIAMMQMEPEKADIQWLASRFDCESPFVFYHAALALNNAANVSAVAKSEAVAAAQHALSVVKSFSGEPDRGTVEALEILARLR